MSLSIKNILALCAVCVLVGMVALILSFSHISSSQVLQEHVRALLTEKSRRLIAVTERPLDRARRIAGLASTRLASGDWRASERTALERELWREAASVADITGIYIGWSNGEFLYVKRKEGPKDARFRTLEIRHSGGETQSVRRWRDADFRLVKAEPEFELDYDPRERAWYKAAVGSERPVWVGPYRYENSRTPGVTVASPAYDAQGEPSLVVGIDLSIHQLSQALADLELADGSLAFLATGEGRVIASSGVGAQRLREAEGPALPNIQDTGVGVLRRAVAELGKPMDAIESGGRVFEGFRFDQSDYHLLLTRFPNAQRPWLVGLIIPDAAYLTPLAESRPWYLLAAIGIALVLGLGLALVGRSIVRPIGALSRAASTIQHSGFVVQPRVDTSYAEIRNLSQTLVDLVDDLQKREKENRTLNEDLRELNTHLQAEVDAQTRDLRQTLERANRADESKSRLMAMTNHELRTPLTTLVAGLELLGREGGNAALSARVRALKKAGSHLLTLVDNIMDFSRPADAPLELERQTLDIRRLLEDTAEMWQWACEQRGLRLECEIDPDLPLLVADAGRMRQVITNLLSNAYKYTPSGGITLSAWAEAGAPEGICALCVAVTDTGPGIGAADRERIFSAFERGSRSGDGAPEGFGLGLSISRRIVEAMGGSLELDSLPGRGSRFTVSVSLAIQAQPCDAAPSAAVRPLSLLLVDDHPENLALLAQLLRADGHRVVACASGQEAINAYPGSGFDAVLMDIRMPDIDGFELCRRLRQMSGGEPAPLLLGLSANAGSEHEVEAERAGMDALLSKPISLSQLYALLFEQALESPWSAHAACARGESLFDAAFIHDCRQRLGEARVQQMWRDYHASALEQHHAIEQALEGLERQTLAWYFHRLANSASSVGLTGLVALCKELEEASLSAEGQQLRERWQHYLAVWQEAVNAWEAVQVRGPQRL